MGGLPQDAPDFTPSWLSEALGTEVVGVEVLDRTLATNLHLRLGLEHADPGAGPATVFVKLPPIDPAHREAIGATGMGMREARFYAEIGPAAALRVPTTHFAAVEDDGSFVLLLEDLSATGCRMSDGSWGVPGDLAAGALEDLARFHVRYEDAGRRDAVAGWAGAASGGSEFALVALRHVLDEFGGVLTPAYAEVGELYLAHHARLEALWDAGPRTIAHGDAHIGNVFLDGDRVGFLDWGLCKVSGPMRDVSYFLTMTVEPEDRHRMEADLLRHYLDVRRSLGGAEIAFDEAWEAHRVHAGYTVIASFLGLMPMYDTEETRPFATAFRERSMRVLEDLDVVPALKAALA